MDHARPVGSAGNYAIYRGAANHRVSSSYRVHEYGFGGDIGEARDPSIGCGRALHPSYSEQRSSPACLATIAFWAEENLGTERACHSSCYSYNCTPVPHPRFSWRISALRASWDTRTKQPSTSSSCPARHGETRSVRFKHFQPWSRSARSLLLPTQAQRQLVSSDTGIKLRAFAPLPLETFSSLRKYQGPAVVLASRFVCMRPSIQQLQAVFEQKGVFITGDISFNASFANSGIKLPSGCEDENCFENAARFRCSLPILSILDHGSNIDGDINNGVCLPNATESGRTDIQRETLSTDEEPISDISIPLLVYRTDLPSGTSQSWYANPPNGTGWTRNGTYHLSSPPTSNGEWVTYSFPDESRINISLRYKDVQYHDYLVELSSHKDLSIVTPTWNPQTSDWDSTAFQMQLGLTDPLGNSRGTGHILRCQCDLRDCQWLWTVSLHVCYSI